METKQFPEQAMFRSWSRLSPGILFIGGNPSSEQSVEFWSPSDPKEGSCQLNDYPRDVNGPTANLVSGQLVSCYYDSCDIYNGGGDWRHLVDTISDRKYLSSAVRGNRLLLIGGGDKLRSTEWISLDGSPAQLGPFDVRHGYGHCSAQISEDEVVVSGS